MSAPMQMLRTCARAATLMLSTLAVGAAGCSAEVIPASGRLFVYPRLADGATPDYTSVRLTVVGYEKLAQESTKTLGSDGLDWTVEGGRYGNTTEREIVVALYKESRVITAKKVAIILPWSGQKRLDVLVPQDCGTAVVPGTTECDPAKLTAEWVDVTKLPDDPRKP